MAKTKQPANIVGKEVQKRRYALRLTQEEFAAHCQLHGLDISRGTLSQIESQVRCVSDGELLKLATILGVTTDELFPASARKTKRTRKS
jgi:transcriptional regulator with XRE-family HTH domain